MAADIQRYLDGKPVLAHGQTAWYHFEKFARRRWLPLLAVSAAAGALIAGASIAMVQARQARLARQRAEDRLTQMVGLSNRALTEVSPLMERLPGATPARQALIESNLDLLHRLSKDTGPNVALRIALAKAYHRLGDVQGGPDAPSPMDRAAAERSFRAAASLLEAIPKGAGGVDRMLLWLEAQRKIGTLLDMRSDSANAISVLSRAVASAGTLPPEQRADKGLRQSVAAMYMILSRVSAHADLSKAREYAALCLIEFEFLNHSYPDDADLLYDLSRAYVQLGFVLLSMGDPEATAPYYEKAMRLRERLVSEHPSDMLYRRSLFLMYQHYGSIQGSPLLPNLEHSELAKTYYEKALALYDSGTRDPHDLTGLADYGGLVVRLGALEIPGQEAAVSLATLRRGTTILESAGIAAGDLSQYRVSLATGYLYMGHRLRSMRRYPEAATSYRHAIDLLEPVLQRIPDDRDVSKTSFDAQCGLAGALASTGKKSGALDLVQSLIPKTASDATRTAQAHLCVAKVHGYLREWQPARAAAQEALSRIEPLASGKRGDPNAVLARQAKVMLAEFAGK
jgi:tetratricopeptide (TPR) repeat protein